MPQTPLSSALIGFVAGLVGAFLVLTIAVNSPQFANRLQSMVVSAPTTSPSDGEASALTPNENLITATVEKAQPAVVSIVVTKDVPVLEQYFEGTPQTPFDDFFGTDSFLPFQFRVPQLRQRGTEQREIGGGSGFLVSADGHIVTNRHVVADESASYTVFTTDGEKHEATVVARDPANDIAVLKISGNNMPHLTFANSDQLKVGQTAIAIGNALSEFRNSVSVGVISGLSRSIVAGDSLGQAEQLDEVIQTDAAINPGNSGGPLLNTAGQVVGVNVAVALGSENIGFALPANAVKEAVESVQKTGKIIRPFLGIRYVQITPILKERNNLSVDYGVLISRGETPEDLAIIPGSSADKAGIREGDIILEIDGQRLTEERNLASMVRTKKVGDAVKLKVLSQDQEKTIDVTLQESTQ